VLLIRYVKQLACRFHPEASLVEDYRAGDMVCPECGLVVGDVVTVGFVIVDVAVVIVVAKFNNEFDGIVVD
ncbi:unnamed protein product, partial [Rotaria sp. Silwood1]